MNENKNRPLLGFDGYGARPDGKIFNAETRTEVPKETAEGKNYPVVTIEGKQYSARRLVWEAFNGPIEGGQCVTVKKGHDRSSTAIDDLELFTPKKELKLDDFYNVFADMVSHLKHISASLYNINQKLNK